MKRQLDFIVIGAQKSGTTALFEYLRRHPELALPEAKEVPYFSHDANYRRDFDEYLRKAFAFAGEGRMWGTVTPHYMVGGIYDAARFDPPPVGDVFTVPARIHARLPEVKLIALLRDPVERARSHHAMAAMNGWETRPFARAVEELLREPALAAARAIPEECTGYIAWGEYGRILAGYYDQFPPEQILVLYGSELKADPAAVMRRVFEFLAVDPDFVPDNLGTTYRPTGAARRLTWLDLNTVQRAASANQAAKRLWHVLPEPTRRRVDRRFDRLNYLTDLWNRRAGAPAMPDGDAEVMAQLRAHYDEDAQELAGLAGAPPPWIAERVA